METHFTQTCLYNLDLAGVLDVLSDFLSVAGHGEKNSQAQKVHKLML